jgi:hypothetical protein
VHGQPVIYFIADFAAASNSARLEEAPSDTGDPCHRNLHNVSDKEAGRFLSQIPKEDWKYCDGDTSRDLTSDILSTISVSSGPGTQADKKG